MSTKKPTIVIYHGDCDDGFAAAFAVRQALGDAYVDYYPGAYGMPPPDVTGQNVIMVDFSYKRPVLEEMKKQAMSIRIFDHHKTAWEDLKDFQCEQLVFDMERSGAGLAWDVFHNGAPRPLFIEYIEDRDLWRKELPNSDEFTIALRSYPQKFEVWEKLFYSVAQLQAEGGGIQRYYRQQIEKFKETSYASALQGINCYISNAPYFAASEVAGELAELDLPFGACYFEKADGKYQYSLRSRGDFDVSEIAKKYGGGGHKNAAGFNVNYLPHKIENKKLGEEDKQKYCDSFTQ